LSIIGQIVAIVIVFFGLKYEMPIGQCIAVVLVAVAFNSALYFYYPNVHVLGEREAAAHLGFDILQLTSMLALTGGIENPFSLLFLRPL
jgi:two-component system sensor histidine kinase RegB